MEKSWSERLSASYINPNVEKTKNQFAEILIPLYDPSKSQPKSTLQSSFSIPGNSN